MRVESRFLFFLVASSGLLSGYDYYVKAWVFVWVTATLLQNDRVLSQVVVFFSLFTEYFALELWFPFGFPSDAVVCALSSEFGLRLVFLLLVLCIAS